MTTWANFFFLSTADYCSQRYYKTSSEGEFQWCIPCLWIDGHRSKSDYTVQPIIDWWPLPGWHLSSSCNYSTINILIRHCTVYEFQQLKMLLSKRFSPFTVHFLLSRFIIILKNFSRHKIEVINANNRIMAYLLVLETLTNSIKSWLSNILWGTEESLRFEWSIDITCVLIFFQLRFVLIIITFSF